jgi:hypothetical protein
VSADRERKILAELIAGEEVEPGLAEQALDRLHVKAEQSEQFKEAIVAALAELGLPGIGYPAPVTEAVRVLSLALDLANEDVPRPPSEILTEGLSGEMEVVRERSEEVADGVHTIPVPKGWSVEQAWEAISRGEGLPAEEVGWANVEIRDGKMTRTYRPEESPDE